MKKSVPAFVQLPQVQGVVSQLRARLPSAMKEGAKLGHLNALRKSIAPDVRIELYSPLQLAIEEVPQRDMILGDSGPVFLVNPGLRFKPFVDKSDVIVAAFLPLTSRRLLIGSSHQTFAVDPSELKQHIASCAFDFFIAAERSDANCTLQPFISSEALPLSDDEIDDLVAQIVEEELQ